MAELAGLRANQLAAMDIFAGCPAEDLMPLAASLQLLAAGHTLGHAVGTNRSLRAAVRSGRTVKNAAQKRRTASRSFHMGMNQLRDAGGPVTRVSLGGSG